MLMLLMKGMNYESAYIQTFVSVQFWAMCLVN